MGGGGAGGAAAEEGFQGAKERPTPPGDEVQYASKTEIIRKLKVELVGLELTKESE